MMRISLLAATATIALGTAAPALAQDWQGPYLGAYAGYAMLGNEEDETVVFDTNQDGNFSDTVRTTAAADAFSPGFCDGSPKGNNAAAGCNDDSDTGEVGLRAGYDWQRGSLVFGVVAEVGSGAGGDNVTAFSTTPANYTFEREVDLLVAARVRLGLATGRFLPYVTGGYAMADISSEFSSSNSANSFTPGERVENDQGWQIGGGVETRVLDSVSVGLEYLYTDLEVTPHVVRIGPGTAPATNPFLLVRPTGTDMRRADDSFEMHSFRLTAAIRF